MRLLFVVVLSKTEKVPRDVRIDLNKYNIYYKSQKGRDQASGGDKMS